LYRASTTGPADSDTSSADTPLIRVAIVCEESSARAFTARAIENEPDLTVVGTGSSSADAVDLAHDLHPEVLMLDLALTDVEGGPLTRSIVEAGGHRPAVLAVTGTVDEDLALAAIRAGAAGVCTRVDPPEVLVSSVRSVAAGGAAMSPPILGRLLRRLARPEPVELESCSAREAEVLGLVADGATNPEIAEKLFISQTTVRSHVQSLRLKLGVRSRIDLVVFADRLGLREPRALPASDVGEDRR
jgi:DNA-binding NarL/FixJ family response regulator